MSKLPTACPACASQLEVTQLACPGCAMRLEGRFELPELLRLGRDDLEFVLAFVRCSGSLKELGAQRGQSYPTVRNRLNDIIGRLSGPAQDVDQARKRILDELARGQLSVKDATRKLKELES
jgi:hypothetical protein